VPRKRGGWFQGGKIPKKTIFKAKSKEGEASKSLHASYWGRTVEEKGHFAGEGGGRTRLAGLKEK